jgi:metalloendopeptidase OMA1, mitochondrial
MCRLVPALFAASLVFSSCATPSFDPTGPLPPPSRSFFNAEGEHYFESYKRKHPRCYNPAYNRQLQRVASRLTKVVPMPGAHWEFVVFESREPNAFALPGGKVGVNSGLFAITCTDAGLAAAVGHEISHVCLNHAQNRLAENLGIALGVLAVDQMLARGGAGHTDRVISDSSLVLGAGLGVMLPHLRRDELQADKLGTVYMSRAGYDPREAPAMWRRFAEWNRVRGKTSGLEYLRTHPLEETRIRELEDFVPVALREYRAPRRVSGRVGA